MVFGSRPGIWRDLRCLRVLLSVYGVPRPYFQATPGPPSPLPVCGFVLRPCLAALSSVETSKRQNQRIAALPLQASKQHRQCRHAGQQASVRSCLFRTAASLVPAPALSISIRSITPSRLPSRLLSSAHCLPLPASPLAYLSPLPRLVQLRSGILGGTFGGPVGDAGAAAAGPNGWVLALSVACGKVRWDGWVVMGRKYPGTFPLLETRQLHVAGSEIQRPSSLFSLLCFCAQSSQSHTSCLFGHCKSPTRPAISSDAPLQWIIT